MILHVDSFGRLGDCGGGDGAAEKVRIHRLGVQEGTKKE
jgi:hypothetical protein